MLTGLFQPPQKKRRTPCRALRTELLAGGLRKACGNPAPKRCRDSTLLLHLRQRVCKHGADDVVTLEGGVYGEEVIADELEAVRIKWWGFDSDTTYVAGE